KQQIGAGIFKFGNALSHLLRCSYHARTQTAIRYRIVFQRNALLKLRVSQPLLVILVSSSVLLHVGNAAQLLLRFTLRIPHNSICRHAKLHWWQAPSFATSREIANFLADLFRWITVHHVSVALLRNQVLGRF